MCGRLCLRCCWRELALPLLLLHLVGLLLPVFRILRIVPVVGDCNCNCIGELQLGFLLSSSCKVCRGNMGAVVSLSLALLLLLLPLLLLLQSEDDNEVALEEERCSRRFVREEGIATFMFRCGLLEGHSECNLAFVLQLSEDREL